VLPLKMAKFAAVGTHPPTSPMLRSGPGVKRYNETKQLYMLYLCREREKNQMRGCCVLSTAISIIRTGTQSFECI